MTEFYKITDEDWENYRDETEASVAAMWKREWFEREQVAVEQITSIDLLCAGGCGGKLNSDLSSLGAHFFVGSSERRLLIAELTCATCATLACGWFVEDVRTNDHRDDDEYDLLPIDEYALQAQHLNLMRQQQREEEA